MNRVLFGALLLLSTFALAASAESKRDLQLGKLVVRISEAESAQVFHVVDQLSEWSEFCHRQYGRWAATELKLSEADRKLLAQHAALRSKRGWGGGLEQTFYVDAVAR